MSSFNNLYSRLQVFNEGKKSPYEQYHSAFGKITPTLRKAGHSSAPYDTIKFIREILYYLDIIDDEELNQIKKAPGFTGKKTALIKILGGKKDVLEARSEEVARKIEDDLDSFINGVQIDRGRQEKYAAQAAAIQLQKQAKELKRGSDPVGSFSKNLGEELLIKTAIGKILGSIVDDLGEEGLDIDEQAIDEVIKMTKFIKDLNSLKSFIKQIKNESGYELIAAYLSSAIGPIKKAVAEEDEEDLSEMELTDSKKEKLSSEYSNVNLDPAVKLASAKAALAASGGSEDEECDSTTRDEEDAEEKGKYDDGDGKKERCDYIPCEDGEVVSETYTGQYLTEQYRKDKGKSALKQETISFKERMKPKTSWQLQELRSYGL